MTISNGSFDIDNRTHDFYLRENGAWVLKGNIGPNGSAGFGPPPASPTPEGTYIDVGTGDVYKDGVIIGTLPGGASVGPAGVAGLNGLSIPGLDGEDGDSWPVPGKAGADGLSIVGPAGADGRTIPGLDGDDGDSWPIPGQSGQPGADGLTVVGPAGADGLSIPGLDGEDGDSWPVPGQPGQPGADGLSIVGPAGADGRTIPGLDGDDGDSWPIPGQPGQPGADGLTIVGPTGADGHTIPGLDGDDGDSWPIPGQPGQPGADGLSIVGPAGADGHSIPGLDGDDGDSWPIPGQPGKSGVDGRTIPGLDGDDGDSWPIPGQSIVGPAGASGSTIPGIDGEDGDSWHVPGQPGADGLSIVGVPGRDGDDGDCAPVIPGAVGRPGGQRYIFNSSTLTNVDPGDGKFTLDNTPSSFTWSVMSISRKNADGLVVALLLQAAMNSGSECIITFKSADGSKIIQAIVLAKSLVDNTTYYTVTVSPLGGSSSLGNGLEMYLDMDRSGTDAGFRFTFTSNTANTDPGAGKFQVNHALWGSATTVSFSNTDGRGVNIRAALRRLMNTGTQCVAQGFTRDGAKQYPFLVLVTGFVDNTTYDTYGIQPITGGVPANGDVVFFTFSKFGDQGLQGASVGIPGRDGEDADPWPVPFAQSTTITREVIGALRNYYVDTALGSDAKSGLATGANAFKTIQKAINTISNLDLSTFGANINIADGTYIEQVIVNGPWVGSGIVTIIGNVTTPANVLIDVSSIGASAQPFTATNGASIVVTGCKFVNTIGSFNALLNATFSAHITMYSCEFGAGYRHIATASGGGVFVPQGKSYRITGNGETHWWCVLGGSLIAEAMTVVLVGTPAFSRAFAGGTALGGMIVDSNTYTGTATGKRFDIQGGSCVAVFSGNVNELPGNAAGTKDATSTYV